MGQVNYDEVNLMLRLYDIRREQRLRQARAWFVDNFRPMSPEETMQKYPQGSDENNFIRMVISYWEMVASFVTSGVLNQELFFQSGMEMLFVWERIRDLVPQIREANKNPTSFQNLETVAKDFIKWLEHLEYQIYGLPRESMVIYLRVPPAEAQKLVAQKTARTYTAATHDIQEGNLRHLEEAAEMYDELAKRANWISVQCFDATYQAMRPPELIAAEIATAVEPILAAMHGEKA